MFFNLSGTVRLFFWEVRNQAIKLFAECSNSISFVLQQMINKNENVGNWNLSLN